MDGHSLAKIPESWGQITNRVNILSQQRDIYSGRIDEIICVEDLTGDYEASGIEQLLKEGYHICLREEGDFALHEGKKIIFRIASNDDIGATFKFKYENGNFYFWKEKIIEETTPTLYQGLHTATHILGVKN